MDSQYQFYVRLNTEIWQEQLENRYPDFRRLAFPFESCMDYGTPNDPSCTHPLCILGFWKSSFLVCGIFSTGSLLNDDVLVLPPLPLSASDCLHIDSTFEGVAKGGKEITHPLRSYS